MDIVKALKKEEAKLEKHLAAIRDSIKVFAGRFVGNGRLVKKRRKKMSVATRAKMATAQKARWAKIRAIRPKAKGAKARRKISAAGRASIVKAQKARWAKIRAGKGESSMKR